MQPILFLDFASTKPYDYKTLEEESLGGTEGTVIRIAEKLGEFFPVVVAQAARQTILHSSHNVTYAPILDKYFKENWQMVIFLRRPWLALKYQEVFQKFPIWVWLHDLIGTSFMPLLRSLAEKQIGFIVVSDFHKQQLLSLYALTKTTSLYPKIQRLYNPIEDDLKPDNTPIDKNQLIYMSSPFKGLRHAVGVFDLAREHNPDFKLLITGLTHVGPLRINYPNIVNIGPLTHADNMKLVRSSFAVFYPGNLAFPETFGLVYAESNAVGTPVLSYNFGPASEVLNGNFQLVEPNNKHAYVNRLMEWYHGERPHVAGKDEYRISQVVQEWKKFLEKTIS